MGSGETMVAFLLLAPLNAAAQSTADKNEVARIAIGREVVVTGEPGEPPATVYGVEDVTVNLFFDAPLWRPDGGAQIWPAAVPGADVRLHPFRDNALLVTPSKALSREDAGPWRVALADGGATLALTLIPERMDHVVRILRLPPAPDAGAPVTRADLQELASGAAIAVLGGDGCNPLTGPLSAPVPVEQDPENRHQLKACAGKAFNYLLVHRSHPLCLVTSARLLRGRQPVEVLLLGERPVPGDAGTDAPRWQMLVTRSPPEAAGDFELLLLAADSTVCERYDSVKLSPAPGIP